MTGAYIFKGSSFDMYIIAWGYHLKGTYTHNNGVLNLNYLSLLDSKWLRMEVK